MYTIYVNYNTGTWNKYLLLYDIYTFEENFYTRSIRDTSVRVQSNKIDNKYTHTNTHTDGRTHGSKS